MPPLAPCLMVQGTASDAGKSLLVTALCRLFARAGHRVAPFKAQNMSLNAAVTADGAEIGRAQAAQADAAGAAATADMNPILLKPEADGRSQLVVLGRGAGSVDWHAYRAMAPRLLATVGASLARLRATHDVVVIEGAGSPAEPNFRDDDIVNMAVARLADAPVLLVGDIDRGGVFAAFVGTLALLEAADRARVAGLVVNKFRGERRLLTPALADVTRRTGVPVIGVVPHLGAVPVPAEDSLALDTLLRGSGDDTVTVGIVRLPHIANFDDFEPLAAAPGVGVRLIDRSAAIPGCDAIVLPGSKTTLPDLAWLRERGLAGAIADLAGAGGAVLGICGGYQMLGDVVRDPDGVESPLREARGLGLLAGDTTIARDKRTARVHARVAATAGPFAGAAGVEFDAYEIHCGVTRAPAATPPFAILAPEPRDDGAQARTVVGTYLHGLFDAAPLRAAYLGWLASRAGRPARPEWKRDTARGARWDTLADAVGAALDLDAVGGLVGLPLR